jgi:hypothetical protein
MSDPSSESDRAPATPADKAPQRRPWQPPTLQRLSLSLTEAGPGTGADGSVETTLS